MSDTRGTTTTDRTMTAMVQQTYGPASRVLSAGVVGVPAITDAQVLVEVHSASVNALEWHLMTGKPRLARLVFGLRRPKRAILGADFSGTVAAVGAEVQGIEPGDQVFGSGGTGSYAQYLVCREAHVVEKPAEVTFEDAAAVGVAGLTALQGLRDVAGLEPGQSVLVNGASGGVGTYAIQIAKALGAHVTAVCSPRNVAVAESLGADRVIDYDQDDFTSLDERFDVLFDIPGNRRLSACKRLLAPGGRYVLVGGPKGNWLGPIPRLLAAKLLFLLDGRAAASFTAETRADDLAELGEMLASGRIRSVIEDTVNLRDVGAALDRQGEFHARGKTVVRVGGSA